jgi:hypothetical protein
MRKSRRLALIGSACIAALVGVGVLVYVNDADRMPAYHYLDKVSIQGYSRISLGDIPNTGSGDFDSAEAVFLGRSIASSPADLLSAPEARITWRRSPSGGPLIGVGNGKFHGNCSIEISLLQISKVDVSLPNSWHLSTADVRLVVQRKANVYVVYTECP